METVELQPSKTITHIWGRNFHSKIELKDDTLRLEITQFKKGDLFITEISDSHLKDNPKKFLTFKKVEELFNELMTNRKLQVSDLNCLIIPLELMSKDKSIQINIQLFLTKRQFTNEAEKIQILLQNIQSIGLHSKNKNIEPIQFVGDETNKNYQYFSQSKKGRVEKIQKSPDAIFNHMKPIEKVGVSSFKVKIIRTQKNALMIGICGQNVKSSTDKICSSPNIMALHLHDRRMKPSYKQIKGLEIVEGSVIKVEINMNQGKVSWFHNDGLIYLGQIAQQLRAANIYPMITMQTVGDVVEFLRK